MWTRKNKMDFDSSMDITLRQKRALVNKERMRSKKEEEMMERHVSQNLRKLNSIQRSLMIMMGKDPYPHCSREEALFEYNHPGFCYRRDGTPRCMMSLQESETRNIVNDIEGKQGLNPEPAINVVSDTPDLAEILSSPELVQILCELRNTAAIMSDEELLSRFASAVDESSRYGLLGIDSPLDYLKQYRKNLIHEFFGILKTEAHIRLLVTTTGGDPDIQFRSPPSGGHDQEQLTDSSHLLHGGEGSIIPTRSESQSAAVTQRIFQNSPEWSNAVIEKLKKAQEEELQRAMRERENGIWEYVTGRDNARPILADPEFSLLTKSYLEEVTNNKGQGSTGVGTISHTPNPDRAKSVIRQRKDFEFEFVRQLISRVEVLDQMGQKLMVVQRKRPTRFGSMINPLVKLLRKPSLFSSLTDADMLLSDKDELISRKESSIRFFKEPSSPQGSMKDADILSTVQFDPSLFRKSVTFSDDGRDLMEQAGIIDFNFNEDAQADDDTESAKRVKFKDNATQVTRSESRRSYSLRRVSCQACHHKVKTTCTDLRKRELVYTKSKSHELLWNISNVTSKPSIRTKVGAVSTEGLHSLALGDEMKSKSAYLSTRPPRPHIHTPHNKGASAPKLRRRLRSPNFSTFLLKNDFKNAAKFRPSDIARKPKINSVSPRQVIQKESDSEASTSTLGKESDRRSVGLETGPSRSSFLRRRSIASTKRTKDSWTLKVSRMDIMRLRHELETENVKDKMAEFEQKFLSA